MLRACGPISAAVVQGDCDWSIGCPQSSPMRALEANIKGGHVPQTTDHLKLTLSSSSHPANALVPNSPRVNKRQHGEALFCCRFDTRRSTDIDGVQTRTDAHELPERTLRSAATSYDRLPRHDRVLGHSATSGHDEHLQQQAK